jgi:hypothetical protein
MPIRSQMLGRRIAIRLHDAMKGLVEHPVTIVVVGLSMLVTGLAELLEDLVSDFESTLETYHGLLLFGLVTALRGMVEMVEALEWLDRDFAQIAESEDLPQTPLPTPSLSAAEPRP